MTDLEPAAQETDLIDLDAVGEEIAQERPVRIGGVVYNFPAEVGAKVLRGLMPLLEKVQALQGLDPEELTAAQGIDALDTLETLVAAFVGPDQAAQIMENDLRKVQALVERVIGAYGLGGLEASSSSSAADGGPSRPISSTTTEPTSAA